MSRTSLAVAIALCLAAGSAEAQVNPLRFNNPANQSNMYANVPVLRYNNPLNQSNMYGNVPVLRYNNPLNQSNMYGNPARPFTNTNVGGRTIPPGPSFVSGGQGAGNQFAGNQFGGAVPFVAGGFGTAPAFGVTNLNGGFGQADAFGWGGNGVGFNNGFNPGLNNGFNPGFNNGFVGQGQGIVGSGRVNDAASALMNGAGAAPRGRSTGRRR